MLLNYIEHLQYSTFSSHSTTNKTFVFHDSFITGYERNYILVSNILATLSFVHVHLFTTVLNIHSNAMCNRKFKFPENPGIRKSTFSLGNK